MKHVTLILMLLVMGCANGPQTVDCDSLIGIDHLPMKSTYTDILNIVQLEDSKDLDSCLAANILNLEQIDDPREAPPVPKYVKGDTAFFLLVRKYGWQIPDFLNGESRDNWQNVGIYAYFGYVQKDRNRRRLADLVSAKLQSEIR